ncbi:FxsA family protein [Hoyosella subflava]|uniref:FxsA cytoplasmic membrane protein n=1 Tax=Hoyosella subflava (strain DSM 45089 / JCM 17490 / NBRC 109087 / DQS3-9A1) TaxID=443218 RepID=F6EP40_HOYSD|nr:FxsA family protein [Hoyosella subflava]AEF40506.1 hypothetical protein AS9A_2057 [Hoyosella subflava DQS3-9A1]
MFLLIFLLYVIAEVTALVLLAQAVGILWTVAVVLGTTLLGFMLFGMQTQSALRQLGALRDGKGSPAGAVTDTMLIAIAGLLLIIPGLVTTALGVLILFPPTRALIRPVIMLLAVRRYRVAAASGAAGWGTMRAYRSPADSRHGVVDGVVVSEETVEDPPGRSAHRPGQYSEQASDAGDDSAGNTRELRWNQDDTPRESGGEGERRRDEAD